MVVRRLERSLKHAFRLSPRLKSLSYRMLGFCHEVPDCEAVSRGAFGQAVSTPRT